MGKTRWTPNAAPKSIRYEHSYARYAVRITKDSCLYGDIEDFVSKHGTGTGNLVSMLLDGHFVQRRHSDPEYSL